MKIVYWTCDLFNVNFLGNDSLILFQIVQYNRNLYICYNYGSFLKQFNTLEKAMQYCDSSAKSSGYRVLTEAEMNLL